MLAISLWLALAIPVEDVTLPNGVRVIVSIDRASDPATARSHDGRVVVVVGNVEAEAARAPFAAEPAPSPIPSENVPTGESWQVSPGAPRVLFEWPLVEGDRALLPALVGPLELAGGVLRLILDGGWPPERRRALDAQLEKLAAAGPRDLPSWKEACLAWASPKSAREKAERILAVTLATGNPRRFRDTAEACQHLTVAQLIQLAKLLPRRSRRVELRVPPGTGRGALPFTSTLDGGGVAP